MVKHIVTGGPILHDFVQYELHDEIDLTPEQAEQLLALGEIALVVKGTRKGKQDDGAGPQE